MRLPRQERPEAEHVRDRHPAPPRVQGVLVLEGGAQALEHGAEPAPRLPQFRVGDDSEEPLGRAERLEREAVAGDDLGEVRVGGERDGVAPAAERQGQPEHREHVPGAAEGGDDDVHYGMVWTGDTRKTLSRSRRSTQNSTGPGVSVSSRVVYVDRHVAPPCPRSPSGCSDVRPPALNMK